jgi:hypothetical protein
LALEFLVDHSWIVALRARRSRLRRWSVSWLVLASTIACLGLASDVDARPQHGRLRAPGVVHQAVTKHRIAAVQGKLAPTPIDARVYHALRLAQGQAQADPTLLLAIAWRESRFDPTARNHRSSARGLLQFTTVTWLSVIHEFGGRHGLARYAAAIRQEPDGELTVTTPRMRRKILALRDDPDLQVIMAAEQLGVEKGSLEKDIGRPVVTADLYVLHLLGPTGARVFLTELARKPSTPSVDVVGRVARPNMGLFMRDGRRLTVAETYKDIQESLAQQVEQHASLFAAAG